MKYDQLIFNVENHIFKGSIFIKVDAEITKSIENLSNQYKKLAESFHNFRNSSKARNVMTMNLIFKEYKFSIIHPRFNKHYYKIP